MEQTRSKDEVERGGRGEEAKSRELLRNRMNEWEDAAEAYHAQNARDADVWGGLALRGKNQSVDGEVVGDTKNEGDASKPQTTKKKRPKFDANDLIKSTGIKKIYDTFPYQLNTSVMPGEEARAMRNLMASYKEWAYNVFPGLAFEDFVERAETLGRTHTVQRALNDLREAESKRDHHPQP